MQMWHKQLLKTAECVGNFPLHACLHTQPARTVPYSPFIIGAMGDTRIEKQPGAAKFV